jgi:hypothetical protein
MLNKALTAEARMLRDVIEPVLGTLDGLEMEHELLSLTGVKIFADFYYKPIEIVIESEGFVIHAEAITRERFDFEKMRIRTFAQYDYPLVPFSWDEIDKRPEVCRRQLYAILGRYSSAGKDHQYQLTVFEREIIRYALRLNRPIDLEDVCYCLQVGKLTSAKFMKILLRKELVVPTNEGRSRIHSYELTEKARQIML